MLTITANHQQAAAIVYIWLHVSNKIIIHMFKLYKINVCIFCYVQEPSILCLSIVVDSLKTPKLFVRLIVINVGKCNKMLSKFPFLLIQCCYINTKKQQDIIIV